MIFRNGKYQTDNVNKKEKFRKKLLKHLTDTSVSSGSVATHTSWGWCNGKYFTEDKQYKKLLKAYANVVKHGLPGNQPLTLTEKPKEISPVYVDIDLKLSMDKHGIEEGALYDNSLVESLVKLYQEGSKKYLDVEDDHLICCVFEKEGLEDKKPYWGNGIHLLFPNLIVNSKVRHLIRNYVVCNSKKSGLFKKYDNPVEDIIDIAVVERNNIMLFGSKKPNSKYYYDYTSCYNSIGENIDNTSIFQNEEPSIYDYVNMFSVRRKHHSDDYEILLNKNYNKKSIDIEYKSLGINNELVKDYCNMTVVEGKENEVSEARELVGMLDSSRAANYQEWIRVGWCLYNIDPALYDSFLDFSRRGDEIKPGTFQGEYDIKQYWSKMKKKNLSIRTLRYWANNDSPLEYAKYYDNRFQKSANDSLEGKDYQIAKTFYEMYKNRFVCSNVENKKEWWEFNQYKHRWIRIPGGYIIQRLLPEEFANEWSKLADEVNEKFRDSTGLERNEYLRQHEAIRKIITSLNSTNYRENIMKNLAILMYDPKFNEKLDEVNKHLIGCENGVFDLQVGKLRSGRPDDYMSMSTNINYIPYNPYYQESKELKDFFEKVLFTTSVRKYFLNALSSCLNGENKDQKLFICTGCGSNGKSVTFDLVKHALGDYFQAPRIELLTRKSCNAGQANEDLVNIKGRRCGVFQEPDNNETFNASVMKQLTAGNDTITARRLHQSNIQFNPQMKYFLACNDLPNVKDNTDGTWRRLRVIGFNSKFVNKPENKCRTDKHEYPIDDSISRKMDDWAPYLLSYLVHVYLNEYKKSGLIEPDAVKVRTNKYKSENDHYTQFFEEFIDITEIKKNKIRVETLWKRFKEWFQEEHMRKCIDKKHKIIEFFNNKLDQKGEKGYYVGVIFKARDEDDDDSDVEESITIKELNV